MTARLSSTAAKTHGREPIAIVGIGCRFPGGADTPNAFWRLIRDAEVAITDVPADRWDHRRYYDSDPEKPGKTSDEWLAVLPVGRVASFA